MGLENPTHWIPIVVVLLLVFGARRLPEIGRSLGEGMRGFRDSLTGQGDHSDHKESLNAGPAQQQPAPTPQSQQAVAPQAPASPEPPTAAS